jgi:hypothetical protein
MAVDESKYRELLMRLRKMLAEPILRWHGRPGHLREFRKGSVAWPRTLVALPASAGEIGCGL